MRGLFAQYYWVRQVKGLGIPSWTMQSWPDCLEDMPRASEVLPVLETRAKTAELHPIDVELTRCYVP